MSKARHSYLENHDTCALRRRIMMSASSATCARSAQAIAWSRHAQSKTATAAAATSPVPKIRSPS
jgi:hypothetical protein